MININDKNSSVEIKAGDLVWIRGKKSMVLYLNTLNQVPLYIIYSYLISTITVLDLVISNQYLYHVLKMIVTL
nr:hypothetical protein CoNPh38_CDS0323 [Staphylococcus phage S-CoN_Ph38]